MPVTFSLSTTNVKVSASQLAAALELGSSSRVYSSPDPGRGYLAKPRSSWTGTAACPPLLCPFCCFQLCRFHCRCCCLPGTGYIVQASFLPRPLTGPHRSDRINTKP
ncbi:hypothetical protein V8C26DRAFT_38608 [Trichoderma gracile]